MITKVDKGLISGIRIYIDIEDLEDFKHSYEYFNYKDVPYFIQNGTWFQLNGLDVEILKQGNNTFDMQPMRYVGEAKGKITNTRISEKMLDNAFCALDMDDQIKLFLYNNKPYVWNQLINEFSYAEDIYNLYLRFNH